MLNDVSTVVEATLCETAQTGKGDSRAAAMRKHAAIPPGGVAFLQRKKMSRTANPSSGWWVSLPVVVNMRLYLISGTKAGTPVDITDQPGGPWTAMTEQAWEVDITQILRNASGGLKQ